jgi:hypothetical protein
LLTSASKPFTSFTRPHNRYALVRRFMRSVRPKTYEFRVHCYRIAVVEEDGVLVTGLSAPSTEEHDFYLTLQHKSEHSLEDVRLGMEKPYIEYCGQGWSWYGHIESFMLFRDRISIQMDATDAAHMRNDGNLEVCFKLNDDDFSELRRALERTFHNVSYFRIEV